MFHTDSYGIYGQFNNFNLASPGSDLQLGDAVFPDWFNGFNLPDGAAYKRQKRQMHRHWRLFKSTQQFLRNHLRDANRIVWCNGVFCCVQPGDTGSFRLQTIANLVGDFGRADDLNCVLAVLSASLCAACLLRILLAFSVNDAAADDDSLLGKTPSTVASDFPGPTISLIESTYDPIKILPESVC
ncbi:MAG TPA: hypothetical protein PLK30_17220 [Blastocatellia bacterium]|nr:hypothetical protein [Blastocatellia bacterium]